MFGLSLVSPSDSRGKPAQSTAFNKISFYFGQPLFEKPPLLLLAKAFSKEAFALFSWPALRRSSALAECASE